GDSGAVLSEGPRRLRMVFRPPRGVRRPSAAYSCGHFAGARSAAFAGGAAVPLDYGGRDVHVAVHRVSSQDRHPIQLGNLPLDRGNGVDRLHYLSRDPRVVLDEFFGDLAGQGRLAGCGEKNPAILPTCPTPAPPLR